ncbi:hypothetical protein C7964_10777 [Loktanella sp. PT4BL]|jgi:hypothetical protein|uniref:hypothetical protein n=1 Tax=Loktanella sp. PT4BL TaxID=2135611 RepID=UPI000D8B697C|nr:hypothetical protein [Loktanella sp. PT4BL]PXW67358.1 hypothetical protein C7964_10777 [Loktanella sp. PT4BL]
MYEQKINGGPALRALDHLVRLGLRRETSVIDPEKNGWFFGDRFLSGVVDRAPAQETVFLLGLGADDTSTALQALKPNSITPAHFCSSALCLSEVTPAEIGTTYLLVNVDVIGELEDAVDELISFRKKWPNTVVIMISSFVLSDDFGTYRQLICDATLRSPISKRRVKSALLAARQNKTQNLPSIITSA